MSTQTIGAVLQSQAVHIANCNSLPVNNLLIPGFNWDRFFTEACTIAKSEKCTEMMGEKRILP
jgi:hypothetical protein